MKYFAIFALLFVVACNPAGLPDAPEGPSEQEVLAVSTQSVAYHDDVTGYYAYPSMPGEYPGVIMIHEWWGLNEHIERQAGELASQGYRVLAVDLFGSVATTPEQARAQTQALDQEEALSNMRSAASFLQSEGSESLASLGWCFGGGQSMQLALQEDVDLDATIIYYGDVVTNASRLEAVDQPVLGIFGSADQVVPVSDVRAFNDSLESLGVVHEIHVYEGMGHAFANPSNDDYSALEADDAWQKTLAFLDENLD